MVSFDTMSSSVSPGRKWLVTFAIAMCAICGFAIYQTRQSCGEQVSKLEVKLQAAQASAAELVTARRESANWKAAAVRQAVLVFELENELDRYRQPDPAKAPATPRTSRANTNITDDDLVISSSSLPSMVDRQVVDLGTLTLDRSTGQYQRSPSASYRRSTSYPSNSSSTSSYRPTASYARHTAENGSYYGQLNDYGRPKTVHVRGYYRSDGTYVRGHYRSRPR